MVPGRDSAHPLMGAAAIGLWNRSEEHTSELQSQSNLVCRLLLEKKNTTKPVPRRVSTGRLFPHPMAPTRPLPPILRSTPSLVRIEYVSRRPRATFSITERLRFSG